MSAVPRPGAAQRKSRTAGASLPSPRVVAKGLVRMPQELEMSDRGFRTCEGGIGEPFP